jgi:hypothetical protein
MKFNVLEREINVGWNHIFAIVGVMLVFAILDIASAVALHVFSDENGNVSPEIALLFGVAGVFFPVVFAFAAIAIAVGMFKMKKDAALCRSLAGAFLLVMLGVAILGGLGILDNIISYHPTEVILYLMQTSITFLAGALVGTAMAYLWMLAISAPDMQKARKMAVPAAVFSLILYIISILPMVIRVAEGQYILSYFFYSIATADAIIYLLSHFVFGFIILYHIWGKKLDNAAYLFAALYLVSPVVAMAGDFLAYGALEAWATLMTVVKLALVYGISRPDLRDRINKLLGI